MTMAAPTHRKRRVKRRRRIAWASFFVQWIKRNLCKWNLLTQYLTYFTGLCVYLVLGGLAFYLIEHPNEEDELVNAAYQRDNFTEELAESLGQTIGETEDLIERIRIMCDDNVFIGDIDTIPRQWEYGPAVFFAMTVITTIGYGNLAPVTSAGQTLFCFYALFGIPLFLFYMAILGRTLSDLWDRSVQRWIIRNNKSLKYMSILLLLTVGFTLFFGIPAIFFAVVDQWPYTTALYFVAVTLTTVGFGDFLPAGPGNTVERGLFLMGVVGWLFLGLAFVSVIFTKVTAFYEKADKVITTRVASGIFKKRPRFHLCGCFRDQNCSDNTQDEVKTTENMENNVLANETAGDNDMVVKDLEDDRECPGPEYGKR
ncbi:potassium channel subfamily K member 10-like isoform X2 [Dysidea avara]|uniref:potassium channel subfamily K member 10-like isoform X2 n=1 Tax=Dysidea avara TaxID=196820 RepID=UPI00332F41D6